MSGSDRNLRIQVLLGAVDKLTRPLVAATRETKKMGVAVAAARKRIKELEGVQSEVHRLKQLEKSVVDLAAASRKETTRARELHQAFTAAAAPTKRMAAELSKAGKASEAAAKAHKDEVDRLSVLRAKLEGAGISSAHLAQHEARLARELKDANEGLFVQRHRLEEVTAREKRLATAQKHREEAKERSEKIAGMGTKSIAAGVGLAAPFVLAAKEAMNFEAEMANVRKIVDFKPSELPVFQNRLLKIGTDLNLDGPEMAKIAAQGAMGGVTDQGELLKFSRDAALMKEAMNFGDAQQAGEMAAGWRHAFNIRQEQVHELGDVITGLTRKWGAKGGKGEEIGTILASVGTIAQVAGSGRKETAALAAVLSSMNVESGVASTGIRNLMLNLTRGAAATGPQRKAYKALGIDAKAMAADMQKDAGGAIVGLLTKIKALPRATQAGVLTQLFGARSIGPIGSLLERLDRVKEALGFVGDKANYTGQMQLEYSRKTDTTAAAIAKAKANAVALAITVGNELLPTVRRGAEWFGRVAGRLSAWAAAHPKLARAVTMGALALSGFLIVAGALALVFAGILGPLAMINVAFAAGSPAMMLFGRAGGLLTRLGPLVARAFLSMAAGALEFGAALLLNPVTWIVAGIVLLAAAAFLIWKNWKPISAFFVRLWGGVRSTFAGVMAWFGGLGGRFANFGRDMMQGLINGVVGMTGAVGKAIGRVGGQVVDWFKARLGIHSPSRVFAELGDFTMAGLAQGLDRSRRLPLAAARAAAAGIAASVAVGTTGARAAPVAASRAPAPSVVHHHGPTQIHVHAAPGQSARDIAHEVAAQLERRDRARAAGVRSSFTDRGRDPEP